MGIPSHRRAILKILPPDLIAALRGPLPDEARRRLIHEHISDELIRRQALRYAEELRLAAADEAVAGEEIEPAGPPSDP